MEGRHGTGFFGVLQRVYFTPRRLFRETWSFRVIRGCWVVVGLKGVKPGVTGEVFLGGTRLGDIRDEPSGWVDMTAGVNSFRSMDCKVGVFASRVHCEAGVFASRVQNDPAGGI